MKIHAQNFEIFRFEDTLDWTGLNLSRPARSEITGRYYQGSNSEIRTRHNLSQSHMPIVTSDTLGC